MTAGQPLRKLFQLAALATPIACASHGTTPSDIAPEGAAVRVTFSPPRAVAVVRGDGDTIELAAVSSLLGTVRSTRVDTVVVGVTSAVIGERETETSMPAGSIALVIRDPGVQIAVISRHPRRVELGILGVALGAVLALVLIGLALGNAAT